jgi:hypothetical protein
MTPQERPRPSGGSTTGRVALTGHQLTLVTKAAHTALTECDVEIGPCKVNKIVRRFAKMLVRHRLTFHEFLSDSANSMRFAGGDPELAKVIAYLDRTGEDAVNHVMRERGW